MNTKRTVIAKRGPRPPSAKKREKMTAFCRAWLASGTTQEAARKCAITVRTANSWLKSDLWKQVYSSTLQPEMRSLLAMARAACPTALQVLINIANDESAPKGARANAALGIFDIADHLCERFEMAEDVAKLKEIAGLEESN